jgi:hypothetical protein
MGYRSGWFYAGVTKRCRLISWLTNSTLVFEPKCRGMGGGRGCGFSANEYSCAHGAQINFGFLTPYIIYGFTAAVIQVWDIISAHERIYKAGPFEIIN